jgi:hypothetical protein
MYSIAGRANAVISLLWACLSSVFIFHKKRSAFLYWM